MIEFGVHGRSEDEGRVSVIGRCFLGPIRVGSVFRRMRRQIDDTSVSGVEIRLEVSAIQAYHRELGALDSGLTGELVLKGQAPVELGDGWTLFD